LENPSPSRKPHQILVIRRGVQPDKSAQEKAAPLTIYLLAVSVLHPILQVLHQRITGIINGVSYEVFERPAKASVNRLHKRPEISIALDLHRIIRCAAFLYAGKKLARIGPSLCHMGLASWAAVKPYLASIDDHRPFEVPVFKHPQRCKARFADVLPYSAVAAGQNKGLLDQPARCAL
jgi:hypothetical protein